MCRRDTALQCPRYHMFPFSWQSYRGNSFRRMPALDCFFLSFGTNVASVSSQYAWYFPPTIIISWKFTFLAPSRNPHSPAVFEFPCLKLVSGPDSYRSLTHTWAGKDNPQKTQSTLSIHMTSYMKLGCVLLLWQDVKVPGCTQGYRRQWVMAPAFEGPSISGKSRGRSSKSNCNTLMSRVMVDICVVFLNKQMHIEPETS